MNDDFLGAFTSKLRGQLDRHFAGAQKLYELEAKFDHVRILNQKLLRVGGIICLTGAATSVMAPWFGEAFPMHAKLMQMASLSISAQIFCLGIGLLANAIRHQELSR